ncbi:hypothetical protein ACFYUJ_38530 [Streptomyces sp. NPDC004520]|uniref:hypothetical protein n=1 Tax=Streptomyces sp. NPDC004520 TaxID=3364702 RepID=UPI0036A5C6D1
MSHQDNSVFVDASGRRGRTVRWATAGVGVACLGFLAVVVAGSFGAGPAGGPMPWADHEKQDAPALIQPDPAQSGDTGADGAPKHTATPHATGEAASKAPATPTAEATTSAPAPAATTAAPATTAPAPAATTTVKPGKADQAPGATKRPK